MKALAGGIIAAMIATAASAQTQLVSEDIMVKSPDAGIEIFVRNKRPANMTSFRPERTVVYVHGATYPASHRVRPQARWPVVDGIHRVARLRRVPPRPARLRQIDPAKRNGGGRQEQSADRARRHRREGHRHGGRFRARAPQHSARQLAWLVVGHDADGDLHDAEQRQGRAARALRAVVDPRDAIAGAGRPRPARRLSHGVA